jgi:hypothetical protein
MNPGPPQPPSPPDFVKSLPGYYRPPKKRSNMSDNKQRQLEKQRLRQIVRQQKIREIIEKYRDDLMRKGATGIGIGFKITNGQIVRPFRLCISVQVKEKSDTVDQIPNTLEGIPTDIIEESDLIVNSIVTQKESSSDNQKENPTVTRKETSGDNQKENPTVTQKESSSDNEKESPTVTQKESSSDNEKESPTVTQKESSSDNRKESSSDNRKESSSDNRKESSSDNQKENSSGEKN